MIRIKQKTCQIRAKMASGITGQTRNAIRSMAAAIFLAACGDPAVTIDRETYEPKIVINGFLSPGERICNIKIARNFAVGDSIDRRNEAIPDADVRITRLSDSLSAPLVYSLESRSYGDSGNRIPALPGESYRLDVSARIDGIDLWASSTTTVPSNYDFGIDESRLPDTLVYAWWDMYGNTAYPRIYYRQGVTGKETDAAFFVLALSSLNGSPETFIKDNPFGFDLEKTMKENENFKIEELMYRYQWARPEGKGADEWSLFELYWFNIWFYGRYRAVLYAGDKNYFHFFITANRLMDADGNLHEPLFDIEGDGIGVFGSIRYDSLGFYVK